MLNFSFSFKVLQDLLNVFSKLNVQRSLALEQPFFLKKYIWNIFMVPFTDITGVYWSWQMRNLFYM